MIIRKKYKVMTTDSFQDYTNFLLYCWTGIAFLWCISAFTRKNGKAGKYFLPISTLSKIWTQSGKAKQKTIIPIEELVHLWRGGPVTLEEDEITFETPEGKAFYDGYIRDVNIFKTAHIQKDVCVRLLLLLEKTPNCSSVSTCNIEGDPDSKTYEKNIIELLGRVTLLKHSINVAIKTVESLTEKGSRISIPNAMIAALGHDSGKLPMAREDCKALKGEHPLAAGRPLASIKSFVALPHRNEILDAIKKHHKMPEGFIGKVLQEADRASREMELEQILSASESLQLVQWQEKEIGNTVLPGHGNQASSMPPAKKDPVGKNLIPERIHPATTEDPGVEKILSPDPGIGISAECPGAARQEQMSTVRTEPLPGNEKPDQEEASRINVEEGMGAALMAITNMSSGTAGGPTSTDSARKRTLSIPSMDIEKWWDAQDFLEELKPYINKLFGTRFMAFSKSGYVYAQAKVLEEIIRKLASRAGRPEIADLDSAGNKKDKDSMHSIMKTVVEKLRVHHNVIARELVKDGYFGGRFILLKKDGTQIPGFFTPFHAEAFGSISELEARKPQIIREIVDVSINTGSSK